MDMPTDNHDKLSQLRIDRSQDRASLSPRARMIAIVGVLAVLGAGLALWFVLTRKPIPVVDVASARSIASTPGGGSVLDASGYVTARRQATVSSKITGKVQQVLIEEGQHVKEGQVLATLDDMEARADERLRKAQLNEARLQLAEIQALLANAERELERQKRTAAQKLTSQSELDTASTQVETYQARLASARSAVTVAAEAVRVADVQVDNTIVRAPFTGVVTVKAAQPGEMISPISAGGGFTRTGIGTIVDMDSLEVEVDVNESFINRVMPDQPVEITLNAYPDWKIPGSVIAIIPAADRSKATVKVRIRFGVKDERIVPDMGARVSFLNETKEGESQQAAQPGVLVPSAALSEQNGGAAVFVVSGDTVERRAVKLGATVGDQRQVVAGVRDGERVVLSPPADLRDGDTVAVGKK